MKDLRKAIFKKIIGREDITLTPDQENALATFIRFFKAENGFSTYLLTGSAGTGKTFMINFFSAYLRNLGYKVILLAPTGRAAKVITRRTKRAAFTIHHHIYNVKENSYGDAVFKLRNNKEKSETVYIVDEASMIGEKSEGSSSRGLLGDLLDFVFSTDADRKLILVGDPVQLPPVGHTDSPALSQDFLTFEFGLNVFHAHLSEVKRQEIDSGVLENALAIRDAFLNEDPDATPQVFTQRDVQVLDNAYDALGTYLGYYEPGNHDRIIFITYSNFRAGKVNTAIRHQLFETDDLLVPGDLLMVVKNNYAWSDDNTSFIANGEMGTVKTIFKSTYEERYGLKWMDAEIEFQDNKGEPFTIDCKLLLDLLTDKKPQLDRKYLLCDSI